MSIVRTDTFTSTRIPHPTLRLAVVLWRQGGDGELGIRQQVFWKVFCPRRYVGDDLGFQRKQDHLRHQSCRRDVSSHGILFVKTQ